MRVCTVRGVCIVCSPLVFLLLAFVLLCGGLESVCLSLLALSLHEAAHALMSVGLGYPVHSIELQPFGFVARLTGRVDGWDELCVAAAGPLCSLVIAMACLSARSLGVASPFVQRFANVNMAVACINMLPAAPLDGGRILKAALFRFSLDAARVTAWLGVGTGVLLCVCGALLLRAYNATMLLMGVFLFFAALRELRFCTGAQVQTMLDRTRRLHSGGELPVVHIAVDVGMPASVALKKTRHSAYTVWRVVDGSLCTRGTVDEGELLRGIALHGGDTQMGALVDRACGKC